MEQHHQQHQGQLVPGAGAEMAVQHAVGAGRRRNLRLLSLLAVHQPKWIKQQLRLAAVRSTRAAQGLL
jgi:hypothetical protein